MARYSPDIIFFPVFFMCYVMEKQKGVLLHTCLQERWYYCPMLLANHLKCFDVMIKDLSNGMVPKLIE